jgi:hypothetical protein
MPVSINFYVVALQSQARDFLFDLTVIRVVHHGGCELNAPGALMGASMGSLGCNRSFNELGMVI